VKCAYCFGILTTFRGHLLCLSVHVDVGRLTRFHKTVLINYTTTETCCGRRHSVAALSLIRPGETDWCLI